MGGKESLQWKYLLPPAFTLEETAVGPLEPGLLPAAATILPSAQQGARCGPSGLPRPPLARHLCCVLKQKGCCGGFLPHFVASSLSYPAVFLHGRWPDL